MSISQKDTRIIYKGPSHREDFFVFGNADTVLKWRTDKSIPLIDCVQSFDVYETANGGNEGMTGRASHQQLEQCFGTSDPEEVVKQICEKGIIHNTHKGHDKPTPKTHRTMLNESRGKGIATSSQAQGIHN
ncbi:3229_t:CDS:2 [Ambispora gerdemannii]|uniref:3229_t:CDS:1 n=1 Tax=Ambispora gerdemannii TaxID=144530 RepID=A0A9N9A742_9GLOM|nr:3229_t:CDS:2 [Ambispora gerdemannii]